jgi:penicillin amidase
MEGVHFILDGSSGNDITEYLISPKSFGSKSEWNFVYSANNQPEAVDGFYILVIIFQNRAKRITQLLEPKSELG